MYSSTCSLFLIHECLKMFVRIANREDKSVCLGLLGKQSNQCTCRKYFLTMHAWMTGFRINPEFRILKLTFHRKSASKCWIKEIILASLISFQIIFSGLIILTLSLQVLKFEILKFRILEILNFRPMCMVLPCLRWQCSCRLVHKLYWTRSLTMMSSQTEINGIPQFNPLY